MTTIKQKIEAVLHDSGWRFTYPKSNASPYWQSPRPDNRIFLGLRGSIRTGHCKSQSIPLPSAGRQHLLALYTTTKLHNYRKFVASQKDSRP